MLIAPHSPVNVGWRIATVLGAAVLVAACSNMPPATQPATDVEAISLLGDTLRRPELADTTRARLERDLSAAESTLAAVPRSRWNPPSVEDATNLIWVGRRQAYLGRYRDAIATFTAAIANQDIPLAHPYRHRGHRYITVRQLDSAVADLERAASLFEGLADEVEPDGQPNARGIPTSTLQFNVWYHLGLARYLQGDWPGALAAYELCREVSKNPDALVATTYWQYLTLRRLGERQRATALLAPITSDIDVIENHAYHRLLLVYKGALPRDSIARAGGNAVQDVTTAYGLAIHDALAAGDTLAAPFARIVETSSSWAAFGYIAAEAELARLRRR